jgi:KUP system potassium uptake protein
MKASSKWSAATLGALGVVYGDIGTSPLYALKESFHESHDLALSTVNVYGVLSMIVWSLLIVISVKDVVFILRADNKGEGGILALTALLKHYMPIGSSLRLLTLMGLFGTALLYGDGIITPAISVLSAVEGLELVAPSLHPYIIPITVTILVALFSIQRHGTALVGKVFGPITLTWFAVIAGLGVLQIWQTPSILQALSPYYAWQFFVENSWHSFVVMGSVFLVVTGGEALYSDLGHFGRGPIRRAWFLVVLPALLLNYFGQGALLLSDPLAVKNPFYSLAPAWALLPLIILATMATVIASQALITGVFSLTMQAVQLGYAPRVQISHTSHDEIGQIYVSSLNFVLMLACIVLVLTFKTSSDLVAAYGIAVTTTMVITTVLFYFFAVHAWKWNRLATFVLCLFFLLIECAFWGANLLKIAKGGWFPLVVGVLIYTLMTTWKRGRQILSSRMQEMILPLAVFLKKIHEAQPTRVPGVAVYMCGQVDHAPASLVQSYRHYNCLHEVLVFLFVRTEQVPHVPLEKRVECETVGAHLHRVIIHYGFMDLPNVPEAIHGLRLDGHTLDAEGATYFLGRESLIATDQKGMMVWRESLFAFMSRNSQPATRFFQLPPGRVVEIGSIVEL